MTLQSRAQQALKTTHRAATFQLTVNGQDISATVRPRLVSLTLTDHGGFEADTLEVTLSDYDGQLAIPPRGAKLTLKLGWQGQALIDKGNYTVDEVSHQGPPDQLILRARSADLRGSLPGRKSRSWEAITLADLVQTLASEHDLTPRVSPTLAGVQLESLHQTDESDLNLLTRVASDHDAIAAVKAGFLLLLPHGASANVSGQPLPTLSLNRTDLADHNWTLADREAVTGIKACWHSEDDAERQEVLVGDATRTQSLRGTYANEERATIAANAELQRRQRAPIELQLRLAIGQPDLIAETPISVNGIKPDIDAQRWVATQVTHTLSDTEGLVIPPQNHCSYK